MKVLMVDRGRDLQSLKTLFGSNGTEVILAKNTRDARKMMQDDSCNYVVLDRETFSHLTSPHHLTQQITLTEFIEKTLHDFVKKFKASSGSDLHGTLVKQVEKTLLPMVLQETNGNQVHAAQILGMNRNTLRKKIRELKITLKQ
jgi:DNA-binding protein Fis